MLRTYLDTQDKEHKAGTRVSNSSARSMLEHMPSFQLQYPWNPLVSSILSNQGAFCLLSQTILLDSSLEEIHL